MNKLFSVIIFSALVAISPALFAADGAKPAEVTKTTSVEKLDINSASEKELTALPGIGAVRAKAIVKGRPYKGKDELVSKKILSQGIYDKIKDGIVAKQAK
jgi:competence protein ComEA